MNTKQKKVLYRILAAAAGLLILGLAVSPGPVRTAAYLAVYLLIGHDILKKAYHGVKNLQPFDENFLMAVATIGAIALGEYAEGVSVMLFYQIGELFQSYAVGKSRRSISELMDIRPDTAFVENAAGEIEAIDPDEVEPGTLILVRPGEKIPIDGIIRDGVSSLDTRALTGESLPRDVAPGMEVSSGCINLSAPLRIETTREFGESTASRILDLVENAGAKKSRSEAFISRFARVYTPAVCLLALLLGGGVPLLRILLGHPPAWGQWIYRALTFLVISCPCALVISIPLTFFAGIGGAGSAGILIKGSVYLEELSKVRTMVFDKTGTLTKGVFEVTEICPAPGFTEAELLGCAALAESYSNHPVAGSLRRAWEERCPDRTGTASGQETASRLSDVQELSGRGVLAGVDGRKIACGNRKLMEENGLHPDDVNVPGTIVYVSIDDVYAGYILINDSLKSGTAEAIRELKAAGVKTVMLTGDVRAAGEKTAAELGIDEQYAELLPQDKVTKLEEILGRQRAGTKTAFAGDGINDAPVLSRADVGIAMGALGSDAAIEAADIVLMDDDPRKIAKAMRISARCMRIVYENIWFAIGVKLLCLVLGALGITNMWAAIFADVGVMVIAVLNAVRALSAGR